MINADDAEDRTGPWYRVLVSRRDGDKLAKGLADDAASILDGTGDSVVVADVPETTPPADGVFMVIAEDGGDVDAVEKELAPVVEDRAVALAVVAEDRAEGKALAHRVRRSLQQAKAFVLPRQLVVPRSAMGVYGLQEEEYQEKLESVLTLLRHDADRLLAKREGWEEPEEERTIEWKGPQVRERESFEEDHG